MEQAGDGHERAVERGVRAPERVAVADGDREQVGAPAAQPHVLLLGVPAAQPLAAGSVTWTASNGTGSLPTSRSWHEPAPECAAQYERR